MKKIINFIFVGLFALVVAAPVVSTAVPATVSAAPQCETSILGIPPWYRGLTNDDCTIQGPNPNETNGLSNYIWRIVLNVIQIALGIVAYIALFFVIYGGFLFMTGGSNPSQVEKGKKTIFNAVIGLVVSIGAVAITNFVFGIVGDSATVGPSGVPELNEQQIIQNIISIVLFAAGTVAVIMIVIAGLQYVTAAGDSGRITKAKNMLVYSIGGLLIVISAWAIINFVIERFMQ